MQPYLPNCECYPENDCTETRGVNTTHYNVPSIVKLHKLDLLLPAFIK